MKRLDAIDNMIYLGLSGAVMSILGVFLIGVITSVGSAAPEPHLMEVPVRGELSKVAELHLWIVYKANAVHNDAEVAYHLERALALATDAGHQSLLQGLLIEHGPEGHSKQVSDTIKEIMKLAGRHEPGLSLESLHASLVFVLLEEGDINEARTQTEHLIALATGTVKEQGRKMLEAQTAGDIETAKKLAAELIVGQQLEMEHLSH